MHVEIPHHAELDIPDTRLLLEAQAEDLVHRWHSSHTCLGRLGAQRYMQKMAHRKHALLAGAERPLEEGPFDTRPPDEREQLVREHRMLLEGTYQEVDDLKDALAQLPLASLDGSEMQPRIFFVTQIFLNTTEGRWTPETWSAYIQAINRHESLLLREVSATPFAVKLMLLDRICRYSTLPGDTNQQQNEGSGLRQMQACIKSLECLGQLDWTRYLEPLIPFESILREDFAGAYPQMEPASRRLYFKRIERIASRSEMTEIQVARTAVALAREAGLRAGSHAREAHVGFYLLDDGFQDLSHRAGHHAGIGESLRQAVKRFPDEFYIGGIEVVTVLLIFAIVMPHISNRTSVIADIFALILMIIPASQSAVDLMNNLVSRFFEAQALPKLDFSSGVPTGFDTLVVVATLLIDEKQIHKLVEDLEIRYLANQDHHIHFALLTDLADSVTPPQPNDSSPLVDLAVRLVEELNDRYRSVGKGIIFLLHRHRIFNQRQQVWMGWERKRGKLLDLNKLICGEHDAFPVKSRELPHLRGIRYVITLDSDTQLPRGAAHRLIGTMAHPLNRPVVDPSARIVRKGYGILQPRVDISVHSANHSRLAALQSGETGMDPYSRAVSDVYQDLYGEAIFTGKGLYDVAVLHTVLNHRFPRNALLSHDLIEGAYARVGLVSDVEVVDDYPSHYSAWSRRRHRWVRGDWQTSQWLLNRVPNELGRYVNNPISLTSKWRILDNLRRSLVEIATLCLLLVGWFGLPGGTVYWTAATLALLFLPVYVQLSFALIPALLEWNLRAARKALSDAVDAHALVGLTLIFLPSQVLIMLDAIIRASFRRFVSGQRLLEWETAAQAELKVGGTPVDRYLRIMPLVATLLAVFVYLHNRHDLLIASPILLLWALTNPVVDWLNAKPITADYKPTPDQITFLHNVALRTWRYFAEFSTPANHWLVPDNVQEADMRQAERVSPTNVGLLLNARQAALELGYLTLPEFLHLTVNTLATMEAMPKFRGHLHNWHSTRTLEVMHPVMVTTVDSGNLAGSLIALRMGCRELLTRPMLSPDLLSGLRDHLQVLESLGVQWPVRIINLDHNPGGESWVDTLLHLDASLQLKKVDPFVDADAKWWAGATEQRLHAFSTLVDQYFPWHKPEFEPLRRTVLLDLAAEMLDVTPLGLPSLLESIRQRLQAAIASREDDPAAQQQCQRLLDATAGVPTRIAGMLTRIHQVDEQIRRFLLEMDFTCLLNPSRELLSIGYLIEQQELESSCFDMLASEARMAIFLAIAKGDIPQQTWFRLGRTHVNASGKRLLLSWTGTAFEYLMPTLWMQSYPNTTIYRSITALVHVERAFARKYSIPWGISESGYCDTDAAGNYLYHAFGLPDIALKYGAEAGPVVSPYSSCLALEVDPSAALANLKSMQKRGWLGSYGFYEAGDYRVASASRRQPTCTLVRSWMVHHQGMSLLAICNLLRDRVFQRWFHKSIMVQSTERLLHERPQLQNVGG